MERVANCRAASRDRNTRTASGPSSESSSTTEASNSCSLTARSSTTTELASASQPRPIVPTRNSASTGITNGLRSSTTSGSGGIGVPNRRWTSDSSVPMRSASTDTCCFSSITVTIRVSWTACR
ncbi:Uncharacterised protein [Mycobacteroides abscessus subsp. abscessus]|nr:Uncharacterised protein [Mycobacteroides abscessus subsp. abscessus]